MLSKAEVFDPESADMEVTCRICLDEDLRVNVIAPCKCAGGSKWVHRTCLDRWRTVNEDRAFARCTECLETYVMITREEACSPDEQAARKRAYWWHVTRDFSGMFLLTQGVIMLLALITYACDHTHSTLLLEFGMQKHPKVFYYLCGMVWASSVVGVGGMCSLCSSNDSCRSDCPMCYYAGGGGGGSADCAGCCQGCAVGDCSGCSSASCTGVQCGEAGPFVLVIIAGLALIGMVVSVVAGVVFVQRVFQQHMHILHKQGMAKQFIVTDLAADDGGLAALDRQLAAEARQAGVGRDPGGTDSGSESGGGDGGGDGSGSSGGFHGAGRGGKEGGLALSSAPPAYVPLDRSFEEPDVELGCISSHTDATEGTALVSATSRGGAAIASHRDEEWNRRLPAPSAPLLTLEQRRELADLGLL